MDFVRSFREATAHDAVDELHHGDAAEEARVEPAEVHNDLEALALHRKLRQAPRRQRVVVAERVHPVVVAQVAALQVAARQPEALHEDERLALAIHPTVLRRELPVCVFSIELLANVSVTNISGP